MNKSLARHTNDPMATEELKVISDFYDFALYLTQRIEKFPRHHRYSLGTSMEQRLQTILALSEPRRDTSRT